MTLGDFVEMFMGEEQANTTYGASVMYGDSLGLDEMQVWNHIPEGFEVAWGWCDEPYRMVWLNFDERVSIVYCEGDMHVAFCPTEEIFEALRLDARRIYGRPRFLDRDYTGIEPLRHRDPEGALLAQQGTTSA